jgi:hypothetical protein
MPRKKRGILCVPKYPLSTERRNQALILVPAARTGPTKLETTGSIEVSNRGCLPVLQAKPAQNMDFLITARAGQGATGRNSARALVPSHFCGAALCGGESGAQCHP